MKAVTLNTAHCYQLIACCGKILFGLLCTQSFRYLEQSCRTAVLQSEACLVWPVGTPLGQTLGGQISGPMATGWPHSWWSVDRPTQDTSRKEMAQDNLLPMGKLAVLEHFDVQCCCCFKQQIN